MEGSTGRTITTTTTATTTPQATQLHLQKLLPRTLFNRVFATIYACAILALLYHHVKTILYSKTLISFSMTLILLISDLVLAFMWTAAQTLRLRPIYRKEFPENLEKVAKRSDYPAIDVFICTADPYKEPPMTVVNTLLSIMAYDYPIEKISVYVSDDGGSALTLFALMEAAKFASHWLPFCRKNNVVERSPSAYFESNYASSPETEKIKMMFERMNVRVEHVLERGKVGEEYITNDKERQAFNIWTDKFTRQDHPSVIQVLLDNNTDKDITGLSLPNLIYIAREKSRTSNHHFKGGALNVLLRVSAVMTNAPIILTLDCDMYSNDPQTLLRVLCYYLDPEIRSKYSYIQFPQHFQGINKNDIYCCEFKRLFQIQPFGFDGLLGSNHYGTGSFFSRRAFFGGPSNLVSPEIRNLSPDNVIDKPIQSSQNLELAYQVASCNYEDQTAWGSKIGYRYGALVEDHFTGYRQQCEGWRSMFCNPERVAFLGDAPVNLLDVLNQQKRWSIGHYQVAFSNYGCLTYGIKTVGLLAGLGFSTLQLWSLWCIPVTIYAFLPQLALVNNVSIFPKVSEPWFLLYVFLVLGSYAQDLFEFVSSNGTFLRWWNDQRFWNIRGLSCYLFASVEFFLQSLGISSFGFNVTSKVVDDEQSKRYDQGIFDFGVHSPMFVPLTMAALINLVSFLWGLIEIFKGRNLEGLLMQMLIAGYAILNCWPIYEAMILRNDKGKMPAKTTIIATFLSLSVYAASSLILK